MELDIYVDMPGFIELFEFVVNMGAKTGVFIPSCWSSGASSSIQKCASWAFLRLLMLTR